MSHCFLDKISDKQLRLPARRAVKRFENAYITEFERKSTHLSQLYSNYFEIHA
jgi:hypothetical protein